MCERGGDDEKLFNEKGAEDEVFSAYTAVLKLRKDTLSRNSIGLMDVLQRNRYPFSTGSRLKLCTLLGWNVSS
jgi:hypothetical protein